MTAKIELVHDGSHGRLLVDGMDLSRIVAPNATLELGKNQLPTLTVSLMGAFAGTISGRVKLDEETTAWLVTLGWSPPEDDS